MEIKDRRIFHDFFDVHMSKSLDGYFSNRSSVLATLARVAKIPSPSSHPKFRELPPEVPRVSADEQDAILRTESLRVFSAVGVFCVQHFAKFAKCSCVFCELRLWSNTTKWFVISKEWTSTRRLLHCICCRSCRWLLQNGSKSSSTPRPPVSICRFSF